MLLSAGCVFTDGKLILTGLQKKYGKMLLSGIGGRKKPDDASIHETAIRETIEEIFDIEPVDKQLIEDIIDNIVPTNILESVEYVNYIYTMNDLENMINRCSHYIYPSGHIPANKFTGTITRLYKIYPISINDLIWTRNIHQNAEIKTLCLLPLENDFTIDIYFKADIQQIILSNNH